MKHARWLLLIVLFPLWGCPSDEAQQGSGSDIDDGGPSDVAQDVGPNVDADANDPADTTTGLDTAQGVDSTVSDDTDTAQDSTAQDSAAQDTTLGEDTGRADSQLADTVPEDGVGAGAPSFVIGTWNLHNFSVYGTREFRIDEIATTIDSLNVDILAVQELKIEDGTNGTPPQAFDALLDELTDFEGVHAPYDSFDSTVGLLYRSDVVEVESYDALFESSSWAFPRPPLRVTLTVTRDGESARFTVIVLHLKAFGDSADRRLAACEDLDEYVQGTGDATILIGDLNDDPYDTADENVFLGSFLEDEDYVFVTASLPPESVTSTGWYHWVGDQQITGEFIDHAIVTSSFYSGYEDVAPEIISVPENDYRDWRDDYSDHFPVIVTFDGGGGGQ